MKKVLSFSIMFIMLFGILGTTVLATESSILPTTSVNQNSSVKLVAKANKQTITPGDELIVTLSLEGVTSDTEITSFKTAINYDTKIFETIVNNISTDIVTKDNVGVLYNDGILGIRPEQPIKENKEIAKIIFKVKETAKTGTSTNIRFEEVQVNENETIDSAIVQNVTIGLQSINSIALTEIKISKAPEKTVYKAGEKFDPKGMEITAIYADGTKRVVADYTYEPMGELKETDKAITISYSAEADKNTQTAVQKITVNKDGKLPQTGITDYPYIMVLLIAIAVVSFIGLRKYRNV